MQKKRLIQLVALGRHPSLCLQRRRRGTKPLLPTQRLQDYSSHMARRSIRPRPALQDRRKRFSETGRDRSATSPAQSTPKQYSKPSLLVLLLQPTQRPSIHQSSGSLFNHHQLSSYSPSPALITPPSSSMVFSRVLPFTPPPSSCPTSGLFMG